MGVRVLEKRYGLGGKRSVVVVAGGRRCGRRSECGRAEEGVQGVGGELEDVDPYFQREVGERELLGRFPHGRGSDRCFGGITQGRHARNASQRLERLGGGFFREDLASEKAQELRTAVF